MYAYVYVYIMQVLRIELLAIYQNLSSKWYEKAPFNELQAPALKIIRNVKIYIDVHVHFCKVIRNNAHKNP